MLNYLGFVLLGAIGHHGASGVPERLPVESWYGPAEVRFAIPNVSDPYDPAKTDVVVKFVGQVDTEERIAYYDGKWWRVRLLAKYPGSYTPHIYLNGRELDTQPSAINVNQAIPISFVRVDPSNESFVLGDGSNFWPIGHNLAWNGPKPVEQQMPAMHAAGINWARIWSTYWDGRNPYWEKGKKLAPYEIDQAAMDKWDAIVRAAESYDLKFQWVLHHHGQVSSAVNPNWNEHPWNVKNGGFLNSAEEFFTNAEAKRRTKAMLRYIVARYADSPSIMAWELFNEVQYSDAARNGHWDTVGAWHDEMADYLRSIDPYHHLITTSSDQSAPIWSKVDYRNDHGYPANLEALLLSTTGHFSGGASTSGHVPFFFGEVGLGGDSFTAASEKTAIRDGIWSAVLAGHAGSGQYWFWDRMDSLNLYPEFERATKIFTLIDAAHQFPMKPLTAKINAGTGADLEVAPGRGWDKSTKQEFLWPVEADAVSMGQLSSFLQGSSHAEMGAPRDSFTFKATKPGLFTVKFNQASGSGADVAVILDGETIERKQYDANAKITQPIVVKFGAGRHELVIKNLGRDWINIERLTVTGIAPSVTGAVASSPALILMRLHAKTDSPTFNIEGLGLPDGETRVRVFDLETGSAFDEDVKVTDGKLQSFPLHGLDVIVAITK